MTSVLYLDVRKCPLRLPATSFVVLAGAFGSLGGRGIRSRIISGERVAHRQALPKAIRRTDKQWRCGVGIATQDRCGRSTWRSRCSRQTRSWAHGATEPTAVCDSRDASLCRIAEPETRGRTCRESSVRVDVNRPRSVGHVLTLCADAAPGGVSAVVGRVGGGGWRTNVSAE
jgi:hypothetical protein